MSSSPVRDAYSALADQHIALFDGDRQPHEADAALIARHLTGLPGPVLDLGCGPGYWTAFLHARGADVTGVDLVPEFVAHARAHHPGPAFRLASMTDVDVPARSAAGVLAWYSTIHLAPPQFDDALTAFRRLLVPGGTLVIGFFDSDDDVGPFDHAVVTAYRRPADVVARHLADAGFDEVERLRYRLPERSDRAYAAIAARVAG